MSLKTCKTLQIIALCIFALALLLILLSIPLQHELISAIVFNSAADGAAGYTSSARSFPTAGLFWAAAYIAISAVHLYVLKNGADARKLLLCVVICSVAFFAADLVAHALNSYLSERAALSVAEESTVSGLEKYNNQVLYSGIIFSYFPLITAPAKILMLLSFGGSIGKSEKASAASAASAANAQSAPAAASAAQPETAYAKSGPSLTMEERVKRIELPGLGSVKVNQPGRANRAAEDQYAAFKRPEVSESGADEASATGEGGSGSKSDTYMRAFQRPKED